MEYTIKAAMKTGNSHPTYGTEYYLQFEETEATPTAWFKKDPETGSKLEGSIDNNRFKKVKKEWKPSSSSQSSSESSTASPSYSRSKSTYKDNSDGMRQGMCFNNAANYVNTLEFKQALTDTEWADLVFNYAKALYLMGDLNQEDEHNQEVASTVEEVFGVAVPANG